MKIIQLTSENIKALKAVEITPEGNVVVISGRNGAGKSSVLDSIYWALAGAKNIQDKPIRDGEEEARIQLNLGEIIVTRKFTPSGTQLVVTSAEGAQFPSPQKMLDELIGAITFDPLEFSRMPAKEQVKVLRETAQLDVDFEAVDAANKEDYDERTFINREVKALEARLNAIPPEARKAKLKPVDVGEMVDKLQAAQERADAVARLNDRIAATENNIAEIATLVQAEHARHAKALEALANERERLQALLADGQKQAEAISAPSEEKLQKMRDYIKSASDKNELARHSAAAAELAAKLDDMREQSQVLTDNITRRTENIARAIAEAEMPVEGLSLTADAVTFGGIPFEQVNSAEKLKVSVAIAMASNPRLRVIRIENGSLLDSDGMEALRQMAAEKDFQIWVERVGEEEMSIIIEDGGVKEAG